MSPPLSRPSIAPRRTRQHQTNHHHLDLYTKYIQHIFERVCPTANPLQLPRSTPPFSQRILTNLPLRHPTPTPGIHNIYLEAAIHNTVNVLSGGFGKALSGGFVLAWRFVNMFQRGFDSALCRRFVSAKRFGSIILFDRFSIRSFRSFRSVRSLIRSFRPSSHQCDLSGHSDHCVDHSGC